MYAGLLWTTLVAIPSASAVPHDAAASSSARARAYRTLGQVDVARAQDTLHQERGRHAHRATHAKARAADTSSAQGSAKQGEAAEPEHSVQVQMRNVAFHVDSTIVLDLR